jgi:hypothetical protein
MNSWTFAPKKPLLLIDNNYLKSLLFLSIYLFDMFIPNLGT